MTPNRTPPPETKTRFEAVLLQMREMILSGELPPGSRVQEIALGARLGVSRTPVRLSLSVLEQEGLVRGEPNRGFTVRQFSTEEVLAAYDVRSVLEGYACRIVTERGLSSEEASALDACLNHGDRLLAVGYFDASAIREWSDMNGRFHEVMVSAAGNPTLAATLQLVDRYPLAAPSSIVFRSNNLERLFEIMRQAQGEHKLIVEAMKSRQVTRAEALMSEHIYRARQNVYHEINESERGVADLVRHASDV
jgi:GntR family transcriptional regulator of vanillate catabolism